MSADSHIAFKEWAVVVDALGRGEQALILRKGGIHERHGWFQLAHREFWLFPTQFHEAETAVIPSHRPALRALAALPPATTVAIQFYAVVAAVHSVTEPALLPRLHGRHIWSESVVQQRFAFGRAPGLLVLVTRILRLPAPERLPLDPRYGGCQSWVELARPLATSALTPVLADDLFATQQNEIADLLHPHALAPS